MAEPRSAQEAVEGAVDALGSSPGQAEAVLSPMRTRRQHLRLPDEVRYIQRPAAAHDGRVVTLGQFVLFSTETGDAWLLDPSDHFAASLARDGDPEPVGIRGDRDGLCRRPVQMRSVLRYTPSASGRLSDFCLIRRPDAVSILRNEKCRLGAETRHGIQVSAHLS
jgi:hypothetical protein